MGQKNTLGGLKAAFFVGHFHCWLIAYFVYTCHCTSGCGSQSFVDFFKKDYLFRQSWLVSHQVQTCQVCTINPRLTENLKVKS